MSTRQRIEAGPELAATGLVHELELPATPGPYPTAVMLHGRFGNETVMWVFRRTIPRHWLVVSPRALLADPEGGHSWRIQPYGAWPPLDAFDPAAEALDRFLSALPALYNADPDRTVLMGFSQGAAAAFALAVRRPGLAQGIAGLMGFAPPAEPAEIAGMMAGLPVFLAGGTRDPLVPAAQSQRTLEWLRLAGAEVEYHAYETGHKMTAEGLRDLQAWWRER